MEAKISKITPIILASQSAIRAQILRQAGLEFATMPADIDEGLLKNQCQSLGKSAAVAAFQLARAKATKIAAMRPDALVIGCDQMLECDGRWFDKAKSLSEAAEHLAFLSGRTHYLHTATVGMVNGRLLYRNVTRPAIRVRQLNAVMIDEYLLNAPSSILSSVGCMQIEGLGVQMIESIKGDYFAILGLPILPLLKFLRAYNYS